MRRAFSVIRPAKIVLIEAEIWPNLVAEAQARRIPIALANARLSPRSERRFRRFRSFVGPTFRLLDLVCVPELEDVDRWSALGAKRECIHCTGSIKYDPAMQELLDPALPRNILREMKVDNHQIILGGSTHPGEEQILGEIYGKLRAEFPESFLIIAPRHAERAREVLRDLKRLGLRVALRGKPPDPRTAVDCLLLDSTGELQNWYAMATVVFVGKSLAVHGGQNPVEPIVAGAPVIFGAHMENFAVLANSLVKRGGAIQVHSAAELRESLTTLLRDSVLRRELVAKARQVLATHAGATARAAKLIVDLR
jgi:3-deoxy-D-manno-octulosonic-acid transferase